MCSLEDAFQSIQDYDSSPAVSRSHEKRRDKQREKRKLKEAFGNQNIRLPPPEPSVIEPDRSAYKRPSPAELLVGPRKFTESTSISQMLNAYDSEPYFPHPHADNKQDDLYELGADWTKVFQTETAPSWIRERMSQRVAEVPLKPSPWMDGAPTLWQAVPSTQQGDPILKQAEIKTTSQLDEMQNRLDSMFAKLDALENSRYESNHIELILFILGGIFLIFILDLLVKHALQASIAMGGGAMIASIGRTSVW